MGRQATVNPAIAAEGNRLEAMIDALPLTGAQRTKAWDIWTDKGMAAAEALLGVYKARYKAAYKAAGDEFDQLGQQFAAACRARAMTAGADRAQVTAAAQAIIAQMSGQRTPTSTKLTDSGKLSASATKAKADPIVDAITSTTTSWDRR